MPLLTHVLGPAFPKGTKPSKQVSITRDLIARLPRASHVSFRLHGGVSNTLAFDAAGFTNSADFTVEIDPAPPCVLWKQMRDKTRNMIRRSGERLTVIDSLDASMFIDFYEDNLRSRQAVSFYNRLICTNIIAESLRRRVGRIIATIDEANRLHSAIFTLWDDHTEYYFMSTRAVGSVNGATSLTLWTAIQHAAAKGLTFDMDGIHVRPGNIPNFMLLTGFGGAIKPRYVVQRSSSGLRLARSAAIFLANPSL